jgi:hypothetical protein
MSISTAPAPPDPSTSVLSVASTLAPVFQVHALHKHYGSNHVVKGVSFDLAPEKWSS